MPEEKYKSLPVTYLIEKFQTVAIHNLSHDQIFTLEEMDVNTTVGVASDLLSAILNLKSAPEYIKDATQKDLDYTFYKFTTRHIAGNYEPMALLSKVLSGYFQLLNLKDIPNDYIETVIDEFISDINIYPLSPEEIHQRKERDLLSNSLDYLQSFDDLSEAMKAKVYRDTNKISIEGSAISYTKAEEIELVRYWKELILSKGSSRISFKMIEANGADKGLFTHTPAIISKLLNNNQEPRMSQESAWQLASKIIAQAIGENSNQSWLTIFRGVLNINEIKDFRINSESFAIKMLSREINSTPYRVLADLKHKIFIIDSESFADRYFVKPFEFTLPSGKKVKVNKSQAKRILNAFNFLFSSDEVISIEDALIHAGKKSVSSVDSLTAIELIGIIHDEFHSNKDLKIRQSLSVLSRYGRLGK